MVGKAAFVDLDNQNYDFCIVFVVPWLVQSYETFLFPRNFFD